MLAKRLVVGAATIAVALAIPAGALATQCERFSPVSWTDSKWYMKRGKY